MVIPAAEVAKSVTQVTDLLDKAKHLSAILADKYAKGSPDPRYTVAPPQAPTNSSTLRTTRRPCEQVEKVLPRLCEKAARCEQPKKHMFFL